MKSIESLFATKKTVLAIVAHPDDFEDYFPGTFMYLKDKQLTDSTDWHILVCTDGGKGGRDKHTDPAALIKKRKEEQRASLKFLGIPVENYYHLDFEDGYIHNHENALIERLAWHIRHVRPDILFSHTATETIIDRPEGQYYAHKDHRVVGQAVLDAMYPYSRDLLFFPHHHQNDGLKGHVVREVLLAETERPDVKVDVTTYVEKKVQLNMCFASQMDSRDYLDEYFAFTEKEADGRYYEQFRHIHIKI